MGSIFDNVVDFSNKSWKDLNRKELNKLYSFYSKQFNESLNWYKSSGKNYPYINTLTESILNQTKILKSGNITTSGRNIQKKESLRYITRLLKSFVDADIESPEGQKREEKRKETAYNTWINNHPEYAGYNMSTWEQLTNLYGSLKTDIFNAFGSESIAELNDANDLSGNKVNMFDFLNEQYNKYCNNGLSQSELLARIKDNLFNLLG